jgi:hypothetical protein
LKDLSRERLRSDPLYVDDKDVVLSDDEESVTDDNISQYREKSPEEEQPVAPSPPKILTPPPLPFFTMTTQDYRYMQPISFDDEGIPAFRLNFKKPWKMCMAGFHS